MISITNIGIVSPPTKKSLRDYFTSFRIIIKYVLMEKKREKRHGTKDFGNHSSYSTI